MSLRIECLLEVDGSLRVFKLTVDLLETRSPLREFLFEPPQLLNLDEDLVVRSRSSTHSRRSIVYISIVRDTLHADGWVIRASFRDVLVRCDKDVSKDVFERFRNLLVVADQV